MPRVENQSSTVSSLSLLYSSAARSGRTSDSEYLRSCRSSLAVPESIFGWPAVSTAIQSALSSISVVHQRFFVAESDRRGNRKPLCPTAGLHMSTSQANVTQATGVRRAGPPSTAHSESQAASDNTHTAQPEVENKTRGPMFAAPGSEQGKQGRSMSAFTSLPDELIAMCYAGLDASDLVALEHVSRRMRELVAFDSVCWRRCAEVRWGRPASKMSILASAARHAGTWKQLYSEKAETDKQNTPWLTLSKSEVKAILDIIKGNVASVSPLSSWPMVEDYSGPSSPPKDDGISMASSSPVSVMTCGPPPASGFSVILLVDASSSVTDDDFDAMKSFSQSLVEDLRNSRPESHVAVVQFNQNPKVEVPLTNVCIPKLSAGIESMEQLMGSTDIAAPIRRARQILSDASQPGERAIILLTDGQTHADELQESEREARKAWEEAGAKLYTLGVGRDIDEAGLTRVAAGSDGGMYFTLRRQFTIRDRV